MPKFLSLGQLVTLAATSGLLVLLLALRLRQTMIVPDVLYTPTAPEIQKLRPASEDEVIAEFLKNEFYHPDFNELRKEYGAIVVTPNLQDPRENLRRRHLLFRKRGGLWRELPKHTAWWEVAITPRALGRVRVFPRADWRRYSQRGFSLPQFGGRIAAGLAEQSNDSFLASLALLQQQLARGGVGGSVLLIGIDEDKPLTIIEGNHRMVAAALMDAPPLRAFRFFCGFSPRMSHCCWYQSSVTNFLHYAGNVMRDLSQFRHSDLARLFPRRKPASASLAAAAEPTMQFSGTGLQMREGEIKLDREPNDSSS